eukprot:TRINITY_DN3681_c0_g1_i1.p1 TRINITY_DN3681_c0_g1~~TRINITY_DN3681_c0_g1_i1.p1  ORF type:complete len:240 (+),score=75.57 TRINITY_DN3681_c0_g1_i1:84-722(+)
MEQLAALLPGYHYTWQPAMFYPIVKEAEGTGIFSKHPMKQISYVNLTLIPTGDRNRRICLMSTIQTPIGKDLNFFVAHWSYDWRGQDQNAKEAWEFVQRKERESGSHLSFFVGDFNAGPSYEKPFDFMTGKLEMDGQKGNFTDVWKLLYPNDIGYTFSNLDQFIDRPDRVLAKGDNLSFKSMVKTGTPFMNKYGEWIVPSDHLAVVVDFTLE